MNPGIRTKIVLLTAGIMFVAIGAIILASSYQFTKAYTAALQSRSVAVGKSLKLQMDRLLQLGIRLDNLTGFDEQCRDVVTQYEGIRYAMVIDIAGKVLFHNDPSFRGRILSDAPLITGIKGGEDIVVHAFADQHDEGYTALIPVLDREGRHIAAVGIGFPADIISTKTRQAAFFSIKVGLAFLSAAIVTLLATLSILVTQPLTRLLAVIQEMREKGEVFTRKVAIDSTDEIGQVAMAFNRMTEILRNTTVSKEVLEYQATHDSLTGLPNRNLLADRLEQAIHMARRHAKKTAVLFIDLDNFKVINDSLGHSTGDQVLIAIAERLKMTVRSSDTVSRQAGDEFVIVLTDVTEPENAALVAEKIIAMTVKPLMLENHTLTVTCSVGISVFPKDGETAPELLKNADAALYRAKEQGKNSFRFFTAEMNARLYERMRMESQLRLALERDEFVLHYQPKVNLHTGQISGMEALIRWRHPEKGMVGPGTFIPLAEENGLIMPIGEWALRTACRQAKAWQAAGLPKMPVAVNVSARQFRPEVLVEMVKQTICDSVLDPACIELEVTESLMMLNIDSVQTIMGGLKKIGVQLTMDDFGTGFSSLGYLKRFPFDKLKLDIAFVRDVTRDPDSAAIALAVITMAHSLNLRVIAEGVETEAQMSYLRHHGCDEMQGYYFSPPLPADEFERLIQKGRVLPLSPISAVGPESTLLLVDDEIHVLSALERTLVANGRRILTATSAEEAFDLLARNRIGLVMADHHMPGMTGTEFLSRVRSLHPECVRIAMTGYADLDIVMNAVNRGAVFKFITKPWSAEHLRTTIHEAFGHYLQYTGSAPDRTFDASSGLMRTQTDLVH